MSDFDPAAGLIEACRDLMRFWLERVIDEDEPLTAKEWACLADDLQVVRAMTLTIRGRG